MVGSFSILWLGPWLVLALRRSTLQPAFGAALPQGVACGLLAAIITTAARGTGMQDWPSSFVGTGLALVVALVLPVTVSSESGSARWRDEASSRTPDTDPAASATYASRVVNPVNEKIEAGVAKRHPAFASLSQQHHAAPRSPGSPSGSGFDISAWEQESLLRKMGYRVGHVVGVAAPFRRQILFRAYQMILPPSASAEQTGKFGAPESDRRLQWLVNHLNGRIALAEPRGRPLAKAVADWRSDVEYLRRELGPKHPAVEFHER